MNEIMKVLTIIATLFMPLTFIAGIYGMNFKNMPELEWQWGYFIVLVLMVIITAIMFICFKKRKWI
jgi:magnesium transporter